MGIPKLKLKVESAIHDYIIRRLIYEEFKEHVQSILDEFAGKNLLHQNIGQLTWRMERENSSRKNKFEKIWFLLEQVSPRIKEDFDKRMKRCDRQ